MSPSTETLVTAAPSEQRGVLEVLRDYYELTKPGITQMVAFTTLTGYYLGIQGGLSDYAAQGSHWIHFLLTMFGTVLISAGSCVFNQIVERNADARMKRTAKRPIPAGTISVREAVIFGSVLSVIGLALLSQVNILTCVLAAATWVLYVLVYTPMKTKSTWSLLVGSIPGALPFAGGWTAIRGTMDPAAYALFAILFMWQIPHFLALSWMYRSDYIEGGFALEAVRDESGSVVARQTLISSILTAVACVMPFFVGAAGWLFLIGSSLQGAWLTFEAVKFTRTKDHASARKVLLTSYAVLMGVMALLFLDKS